MLKVLDLFSGTGTVKRMCAERPELYDCLALDLAKADINCDILEWDYTEHDHFDVIFASPPCNCFSRLKRCNIGRTLITGVHVTADSIEADISNIGLPILRKTEEIIRHFKPRWFFIENPQTARTKEYLDYPFYTVDYCMYGMPYRKRTNIWTNLKQFEPLLCNKQCSGWEGRRHAKNVNELGGGHDSTILGGRAIRSKVPDNLIRALLNGVEAEYLTQA